MENLSPRDPTQLGTYRLTGRLGAGGFGIVYEAVSPAGDVVAIKLLNADLTADSTFRDRLVREADAMRRVDSDRAARVIEVVADDHEAYLVMEKVAGVGLDRHVDGSGPFRGPELWFVATGLAEALTAVHAAGIVHRDLKPANVMYGADGVKMLDFGISAVLAENPHTRTGTFLASAAWISPEQIRDERATQASDVFMMGLVLAFAASGRHPFGTGRSDAIMFRIVHNEPDLSEVPQPIRDVVAACLAKDPATRPTARALVEHFVSGGATQLVVGPEVAPETTLVIRDRSSSAGGYREQSNDGRVEIPTPAEQKARTVGGTQAPPTSAIRRSGSLIAAAVVAAITVIASVVALSTAGGDKPTESASDTPTSPPPSQATNAQPQPTTTLARSPQVPESTVRPSTTASDATAPPPSSTLSPITNSTSSPQNSPQPSTTAVTTTVAVTETTAATALFRGEQTGGYNWYEDKTVYYLTVYDDDGVVGESIAIYLESNSGKRTPCRISSPPVGVATEIAVNVECALPSPGTQKLSAELKDSLGNSYKLNARSIDYVDPAAPPGVGCNPPSVTKQNAFGVTLLQISVNCVASDPSGIAVVKCEVFKNGEPSYGPGIQVMNYMTSTGYCSDNRSARSDSDAASAGDQYFLRITAADTQGNESSTDSAVYEISF